MLSLRRRLVRIGIIVLVLLVLPVFVGWIYLAQPTFRKNQRSNVSIDPARLRKHVEKLSVEFHPRNYEHTENLNAAAEYIRQILTLSGAKISTQTYTVNHRDYHNVIARFGTEKKAGEGLWIVGAHYDSCMETPGADDNASGVAGLLELAGLLGKLPDPPAVELVAYSLEEPPFFRSSYMGSAQHAQSLKKSGAKVKGVLILEMIGYFDDRFGSQKYPLGILGMIYPNRGNFLAVVGQLSERKLTLETKIGMKNATPLPVCSISAPRELPGIDFSDHLNYWAQDMPAVMITDTAFYRNKAYHEKEDTADRLDFNRMADGVVAVYESLLRMAR